MEARNSVDGGDDRLMLPVGRPTGTVWVDDDPFEQLRVGAREHALDETQHAVWAFARDRPPGDDERVTGSRDALVQVAREAGSPNPSAVIDGLLDSGLLVEVTPGTPTATAFAAEHRVMPTMLGLGNSSIDPDSFCIGPLGCPIIFVDAMTYDLWQWSAMDMPLIAVCESVAEAAQRNGFEPAYLESAKLLTNFLYELPSLLRHRAAYVDQFFRLPHAGARS